MKGKGTALTCHQWLQELDRLQPTDEDWKDPNFACLISWVMVMFLWRRMNQLLINAGGAEALAGTDQG